MCTGLEGLDSDKGQKEVSDRGAQSQVTPCRTPTPCTPPPAEITTPLQKRGGRWHSPAGLPAPSPSQPRLPGAWETKGSRNQTIFPLNLISSLPSTPPQLEVEYSSRGTSQAGKGRLWRREAHWRASRERARTLSQAPRIGVYSALTAKLMTTRDPSRCSSEPSRPRVPEVNTHREKTEKQSKNPFENTSTLMYIFPWARQKMGLASPCSHGGRPAAWNSQNSLLSPRPRLPAPARPPLPPTPGSGLDAVPVGRGLLGLTAHGLLWAPQARPLSTC